VLNGRELPPIGHIGYVVGDIEAAIQWCTLLYGIAAFQVYDFRPLRAWVNGREISDCELRIAVGSLRDGKKIELIRPVSDQTPHMEFLKSNGASIHHVAFHVNDYDQWKKYFQQELGAKITFEAEAEDAVIGYRRCFYTDTGHAAGVVEISELPRKR